MNEIRVVEKLEKNWQTIPKNTVTRESLLGGETAFWFAAEIGNRWLLLTLVLGKRNGLSEEIVVIDPTKKIVADRLLLLDRNVSNSHFVNLESLREEIRKDPSSAERLCREDIQSIIHDIQRDPSWITMRLREPEAHSSSSLHCVSGGLMSLGKRS